MPKFNEQEFLRELWRQTHESAIYKTYWDPEDLPTPGIALVVSTVALKHVAQNLPGDIGKQLNGAATNALAGFVDDICPRPPGPPWPPGPWFATAVDIAAFARTLGEGRLQADLLQVAGQIFQKGFGTPAGPATSGLK